MDKQEQRILEQAKAIRLADKDRFDNRVATTGLVLGGFISIVFALIMWAAIIGVTIWLGSEAIDFYSNNSRMIERTVGRFAAIGLLALIWFGITFAYNHFRSKRND